MLENKLTIHNLQKIVDKNLYYSPDKSPIQLNKYRIDKAEYVDNPKIDMYIFTLSNLFAPSLDNMFHYKIGIKRDIKQKEVNGVMVKYVEAIAYPGMEYLKTNKPFDINIKNFATLETTLDTIGKLVMIIYEK
jgi:hypothetical protein